MMEKPPIKLNELSPIIICLIEKIQLLDALHITKQEKLSVAKEMLEVVDNFREFFAKASGSDNVEPTKIFNERIERAFSEFDWDTNVKITPYEFKKFSENAKSLISSILKLLGTKGCGVLIIETYLKLCMKVICEMTRNVENTNVAHNKANFKSIIEGFSLTVNMLKKYWHIAFFPNQKSAIMLCLHQMCKVLSFLLRMIKFQNVDLKKYALDMLAKCLNRIQANIHCDGNLQTNDCGQEFITLMNHCLYKLNELSNFTKDFPSFIQKANATTLNLKPMIDELLCYAMSIAHVTNFEDDSTAIKAISQKVLREFKELTNEIEKENGWEIKLTASSVGESLCNLECQVNTAVLKLVLEVFSGVNSPLKNIINKCRIDIGKDNKASEDLNVLISDFDSEMDRIMQIGLFAISCTSSLNRILEIRSCLASLESLETELIPSLTALYMDCNARNKFKFQYLIDYWLIEITELKTLIDSIIDPAGFCGVVENQVKSLVHTFNNLASSSTVCQNKLKQTLKQIVRYSRKLTKTLKTSMKDENEKNENTEEYILKFHLASEECEAVLDLLEQEQDTNKVTTWAMKKCGLLLEALSKLSSHLYSLVCEEDSTFKTTEDSSDHTIIPQIPQKDYYRLCGSLDTNFISPDKAPDILTPYIDKGVLQSKRRNILYTTPSQVEKERQEDFEGTILQAQYWDKTPVSHKRSRCCKPLNLNLELENTIDLEITTILDNISHLSNTFSKTLSENNESAQNIKPDKEAQIKRGKDVACGMEKDTDCVKPTFTSSGCRAKLDTVDETNEKFEEDSDDEKDSLGSKLRNRFIQSLNDLSKNSSLFVSNDDEPTSQVDTPDIVNDIKVVEDRIHFLKQQAPCLIP